MLVLTGEGDTGKGELAQKGCLSRVQRVGSEPAAATPIQIQAATQLFR